MSSKQPRSIETEVRINAPVDAVWKALTDAQELSNWFPLEARVKPGVGGSVWQSWGEGMQWESPIDAWEENRHLRLIQMEPTKADPRSPTPLEIPFRVAVDYYLEARAGGTTVLRLVHSGFSPDASWDSQYDGTVRGWAFELTGLRHYLEHHRGTRRVVVHARVPIEDRPLEEAWRRLLGPAGLAKSGTVEGLVPGDRYRLRTAAGDSLEGVVHILNPPRDLCATVDNLGRALLRLRIDEGCMTAPQREVNFWLSTFGLAAAETDALEARCRKILDGLFTRSASTA